MAVRIVMVSTFGIYLRGKFCVVCSFAVTVTEKRAFVVCLLGVMIGAVTGRF